MIKLVISVDQDEDKHVNVKLNTPKKTEIDKATEVEKEVAKWVYENINLTLKNFTGSNED